MRVAVEKEKRRLEPCSNRLVILNQSPGLTIARLEAERIRDEPLLGRSDAGRSPGVAIGFDRDRDQVVTLADIADVQLDLPVELRVDAAFVAHPQVEGIFRRTVVGLAQIEARQTAGARNDRVADNHLVLPAIAGI